jgi:hypothetical protein
VLERSDTHAEDAVAESCMESVSSNGVDWTDIL